MVKLKFYLLILLSNIIYGQNNSSNIIVGNEEETELSFQKYDSLIIKKDFKKLEDIKNETPTGARLQRVPIYLIKKSRSVCNAAN